MEKEAQKISEAELEVMKVLWERSPITSADVIEELSGPNNWHSQTIRTLIERLVRKGAVGYEKSGRAYLYRPLVDRDEYALEETRSFLNRVFDGSLMSMFANLVETEELSRTEYEELQEILDKRRRAE